MLFGDCEKMIKKTTTITCAVCGADCSIKTNCRPNMVQVYHLEIGISGLSVEGKVVPRGDERFAVDLCPKCYDNWLLLDRQEKRKPTQFVYYLKKDPNNESWWNRRKE